MNSLSKVLFLFLVSFTAFGDSNLTHLKRTAEQFTEGSSCLGYLERVNNDLAKIDTVEYIKSKASLDVFTKHENLMPLSRVLKVVRDTSILLSKSGSAFDEQCLLEMGNTLDRLRDLMDIIYVSSSYKDGSLQEAEKIKVDVSKTHIYDFAFPQLIPITDDFKLDESSLTFGRKLRNGDLLLAKSTAFISSAISKLAPFKTKFSHIASVFRPKTTTKISVYDRLLQKNVELEVHRENTYVIETSALTGMRILNMDDFLLTKSRVAVYRLKNTEKNNMLGDHLGTELFNKIKNGGNCYNYELIPNHAKGCTYCTQLITNTLNELCENKSLCNDIISVNSSHFPFMKLSYPEFNEYFTSFLGINISPEVLSPSYIEVDPNFELIAEWRQASQLRKERFYNASLESTYEWIDTHGFKFQVVDDFYRQAESEGAFDEFKNDSDTPEFLKEVPVDFIKSFSTLGALLDLNGPGRTNFISLGINYGSELYFRRSGEISDKDTMNFIEEVSTKVNTIADHISLTKRVERFDDSHLKKFGVTISHGNYTKVLEGVRKKGCEDYVKGREVRFFQLFNSPKDTKCYNEDYAL